MKILHFADVHIGIENYGRIDPETGLNTRLLDFLKAFDFLINTAIDQKVDLVIFTGDAYKTRDPSPTHQREFALKIKKLANFQIPSVLLVGNHDLPTITGRANTLDIFQALEVPRVFLARKPQILKIMTKSGLIQIVCLPWTSKSNLLSLKDLKTQSPQKINQKIAQKYQILVKKFISQLDKNLPKILIFHGTVAGAVYGSERSIVLGTDIIIPLNVFCPQKFDYLGFGHIHKFQVLNHQPPAIYPGSIERIDFNEEKDDKGFVIVEIQPKSKTKFQFIKIPAKKFLTIPITINSQKEILKQIRQQINKFDFKGAVVRVKIKVPEEFAKAIPDNEIKNLLQKADFLASISKEIKETKALEERQFYQTTSAPLELLEKYLSQLKYSPKNIKILKKYAQKLFQEQENL